jgi:hypothetical protein
MLMVIPPMEFTEHELGCTHPYSQLPSVMGLFETFWSPKLLWKIIRETNWYALEIIDDKAGTTRGGIKWTPLGLDEFQAYISICLQMGLKKLLCRRLYWSRDEPLFHCPIISQLLTRDRFELITRCLHVTNAPPHVKDRSSATYDKLHKLKWMLEEVRERFKAMWAPNQQLTIDEGMVMYKGIYYPICQYMPKKPVRFGHEIWAAVDALSKSLWNFKVYCGKTGNPHDDHDNDYGAESDIEGFRDDVMQWPRIGEGFIGHNVVKDLLKNLIGRGHIVTTDNFFTSIPLYLDLLQSGIMATGTLRASRKYTPKAMFAKKITKKKEIGWVDYRMHKEGNICCVVWKDKQLVVLLSTHAESVALEGGKLYV